MVSLVSTRKLWILQGNSKQLFERLADHIRSQKGDWVTITTQRTLADALPNAILPNQAKSLLGKEFLHGIFDATVGFNLDALAILTGTLVKGSILILLLPENIDAWQDQDSLRWNENSSPICVPNFIRHFFNVINQVGTLNEPVTTNLGTNCGLDLQEQQNLLLKLRHCQAPIMALTAKRGRGKSALAGQFSQYNDCWVTAPNKESLTTFFRFAKSTTPFYPPDQLAIGHFDRLPEYLIIDEAAMIPLPTLEKLTQLGCRLLLTTTVEGYEGTGQGFLLKLLHDKKVAYFRLSHPIRWSENDQIENFIDLLLINDDKSDEVTDQFKPINTLEVTQVNQQNTLALVEIYRLLKMAHYRTTPTDLRRLLDAQNTIVLQAKQNDYLTGALIGIFEGGLDDELIDAVWQGIRRPKGNLVAQSLVAHAGVKLSAKLRSIRINRIAVNLNHRRQGVGNKLIQQQIIIAKNQNVDFLSVSFAYSQDILNFWLACGFSLIHVASHKEASSGSHSVMAIYPISQQGKQLTCQLQTKLQRNWYWLKNIISLNLNIEPNLNQVLGDDDIDELSGFAYYHRPFEASYSALCRLINSMPSSAADLPYLDGLLKQNLNESQLIEQQNLLGRKSLIHALRQEVIQWFAKCNGL